MRCLKRNETEFEYLPYEGIQEGVDDDGDYTGENVATYGDPIPYRGNISTPSGRVNQTFYGEDIRYSHTLVMCKPDADINEYGLILWKGETYTIEAVRPSINAISLALRKQTTDHAEGWDAT